jgi:hypothetical protein
MGLHTQESFRMSAMDIQALQANFDNWRRDRAPDLPPDSAPMKEFVLGVFKRFTAPDKSTACLVKLSDYAKFLTDDYGQIRKDLLEPNVRDYQGKRNPVNADM